MPATPTPFTPPALLRNAHVQTLVSSTWPRKWFIARRAKRLSEQAEDVVLQCEDGIRLHGLYNGGTGSGSCLVILLHGWEGCAESSYQLSTACTLLEAGFDVFRLNLRDHGPSHHLNPELFNSTRLQEVIDAVVEIQRRYPRERTFLAGHSLGGNFALRIAARAPGAKLRLDQVVAVCPVLDPVRTMDALENGSPIYHRYFVHRWKRSLATKLEHFPELGYGESLLTMQTLGEMNDFFVPNYTDFEDPLSYFSAYALTGDTLANLQVPSQLITSLDDPIIPADDLEKIAPSDFLTIETTEYGGHCGFMMNWRLEGWIDRRFLELFGRAG
jgi:hypothetical protein